MLELELELELELFFSFSILRREASILDLPLWNKFKKKMETETKIFFHYNDFFNKAENDEGKSSENDPTPETKTQRAEIDSYIPESNLGLIILNLKFSKKKTTHNAFLEFWKKSKIRICADGGANHLFDYFSEKNCQK